MEKDYEDFIIKRCEKALAENKQYGEMELSGDSDSDDLQTTAETLCYKQGYKDALTVVLYSQEV